MARDVRPGSSGSALIAPLLALALVAAAPRVAAQQWAAYDALIEQYVSGDAGAAIAAIQSWSGSTVSAASGGRGRQLPAPLQRAAVMLHTDAALGFMYVGRNGDGSNHLTAARRILSAMRSSSADERTHTFVRRWFAFVASFYTAQGKLDQAMVILRDGFALYPRNAYLHVARGAVAEMSATLNEADARSGNQLTRNARLLDIAAADYLRALAFDDALAIAHLHLGWVRLVAGDDRCQSNLDAALTHADDDRTRYLAHLFLGRLAERQNRIDDARREYDAALAVGDSFQTAYVALSRVEESLGHSARARELAQQYASLPDHSDDAWWDYHLGGFDATTLEWLRREARTP
jgi:tetratricopeptide (TPR) repeat protein